MSRRLWIATLVAVLACVAVALAVAWTMASAVGGGSGGPASELQERLRAAGTAAMAEEPPLRAFAMLPSREGEGWRWKVEATLLAGRNASDPVVVRALDRMVSLCLATPIRERPPAGVLVVLHAPGGPDWTRTYEGKGRFR